MKTKQIITIVIAILIIASVGFNLYTGVTSLHNKIYADGIKEGKTFVSNQIVTEVTNTGQLRVNINTEEGLKTIILVPYNAE